MWKSEIKWNNTCIILVLKMLLHARSYRDIWKLKIIREPSLFPSHFHPVMAEIIHSRSKFIGLELWPCVRVEPTKSQITCVMNNWR